MRPMGIVLAIVVGGVTYAQPSFDQPIDNSAQKDTSTAQTMGDEVFARQAAQSGLAQVKLAQLAMARGQSLEVKQLARKVLADHSKVNTELEQIAGRQKLSLPQKIDARDQHLYDKLAKLQGDQFDREYVKAVVKDHDLAVTTFKNESLYGQDPDLKSFAMRALPVLEKHDTLAHQGAAKLKEK